MCVRVCVRCSRASVEKRVGEKIGIYTHKRLSDKCCSAEAERRTCVSGSALRWAGLGQHQLKMQL